jgi:hypothetical protein
MLAGAWPVAARRRAAAVVSQPRGHDERSLQGGGLVPRTFSRSAPNGWRYRGILEATLRSEWSATSNCGHGGVLRGWDTTASTRRLVNPPWLRRAGVWTGCLVGREHARAAAGRRRGPLGSHDSATIPRYHLRCGVRRHSVRGTHLRACNDPRSWYRPSETPGPSDGEQRNPSPSCEVSGHYSWLKGCPFGGLR